VQEVAFITGEEMLVVTARFDAPILDVALITGVTIQVLPSITLAHTVLVAQILSDDFIQVV
jgi:hypothetical protein